MITRNRLALAKRSIRCFIDQTYPRRELVIVSEGDRAYCRALENHLEDRGIDNARVIAVAPGATLGKLRNLSLDAAAGDIMCQWDDDDCYHPDRALRQVEEMTRQQARACFLTDNLQLFEADGKLFWLDWTIHEDDPEPYRLFPPAVVFFKDGRFRYPETGPRASLGEDLDLATDLCREVPVAMLGGMGWLYLYVFHGTNTCLKEHHYSLAAARAFPNQWMEARSAEIRGAMQYYPIPGPVVVHGARGPVFSMPSRPSVQPAVTDAGIGVKPARPSA